MGLRKMRKFNEKCVGRLLAGLVYSGVLAALARCLIMYASDLLDAFGSRFGLSKPTVYQVSGILAGLKDAQFSVPYGFVLAAGLGMAALFAVFSRMRRGKRIASAAACVILLTPMLLAAMLFTTVNGICPAYFIFKGTEKVETRIVNYESAGDGWYAGFGRRQIIPDENSPQPLYIAGYNNALKVTDVLDYCEARAVWLDTGDQGVLLIGVDCIGLDSSVVQKIRERLADIPGCASVNVYSTHTHAGPDTLGLWGPVGMQGKNDAYMDALIEAAVEAGREAAGSRVKGELYFGYAQTKDMYRDSRDPQVYDENLYQLRFAAENGEGSIRFLFYGAHPEALRGSNTLLSRDYAGLLCDGVAEQTGDHTIFASGALGGLIMTKEFVGTSTRTGAVENLKVTSDKLVEYALSISEETERKLEPNLEFHSRSCVIPMDNTAFWLYKILGILDTRAVRVDSATGYGAQTEVALLQLDDMAAALIPGEIFPELVYGGEYGDAGSVDENPEPLVQIAAENGVEKLLVIGLSNDEIGYIVPPSDFLVNAENPYFEKIVDYKGENHYEETNSLGIHSAGVIADTFESLFE